MTDSQAVRHRRADAERSIESILDTATRVVLAGEEINMSALARAAGVSRVTLYAHFATREALIEAVLSRALAHVTDELTPAVAAGGSAAEMMAQLLRTSWPRLHEHRNLFTAASAVLGPDRLRRLHEPVFALVEQLIRTGRRDGTIRSDLPVEWLVSATYALLHLAAEQQTAGKLTAAEAGDVVTSSIMSLLTAGTV
ncbi:TetR/AcrR family transcriptional regulator [Hamadaea tsunoensis]|uniref:TetR/AcrR family transcriptional regulator n=1 Tax=Hamadaea tsunoensis TaxID=53368 RepID=UPI00040581A1|nr:TetR/AcrR family transcriptional regulator [Hamadaea tsunoensis]